MYQIEYNYETGNSFDSYDETEILETTWINLAIAKKALKRIKEHYLWYQGKNSYYKDNYPKPSWHDLKYDFCLKIPLDNGNEVQISAPWCGYFETLYGASVISKKDESMSFTI